MHPEMNWETWEALHEMDSNIDQGIAHDTTDMEVDDTFDLAPPGKEDIELSHEEGEFHMYKHLISSVCHG